MDLESDAIPKICYDIVFKVYIFLTSNQLFKFRCDILKYPCDIFKNHCDNFYFL